MSDGMFCHLHQNTLTFIGHCYVIKCVFFFCFFLSRDPTGRCQHQQVADHTGEGYLCSGWNGDCHISVPSLPRFLNSVHCIPFSFFSLPFLSLRSQPHHSTAPHPPPTFLCGTVTREHITLELWSCFCFWGLIRLMHWWEYWFMSSVIDLGLRQQRLWWSISVFHYRDSYLPHLRLCSAAKQQEEKIWLHSVPGFCANMAAEGKFR